MLIFENMKQQKLIVLIDQASLEAQKINGKFEILTQEHHHAAISKMGKKLSDFQPELVHMCLLMLLDSQLNREGKLKVYVRTNKNIIIKINKNTRIPRTFNRFCGLMSQLMQKFKITAGDDENKVLMKIVNPPVTAYFPDNAIIYGITNDRTKMTVPENLIPPKGGNSMVVIIAATEKQNVMESCSQFLEKTVSLSNYEMTSEFACFKICNLAFEKWIEENDVEQ